MHTLEENRGQKSMSAGHVQPCELWLNSVTLRELWLNLKPKVNDRKPLGGVTRCKLRLNL
jgi:hypothetical protein